ncbi:staygreen family protein, partial [Chloroflexota bacterium]
MSRLRVEKLHVRFAGRVEADGPVAPRRYTLTHSDSTGDLYLTVDSEYDRRQVSGWYTRFMRDEVLAEWRDDTDGPCLHVYCHVSGGLVLGTAGWRFAIFQRELPLVLKAFRYGDRQLFETHPELDDAPIRVHFRSSRRRYHRRERWGTPADYR